MLSQNDPVVIVGAGPAGLTAAYEIVKSGRRPLVFEKSDLVGGISRTETSQGYRFDIGGHRFFTKEPEVQNLWLEVLGEDFLSVKRMSRIYYNDKFYQYPLEIGGTLRNLGVVESARIVLSYFKWRLKPFPREDTFDQWVINRFGGRLFMRFFQVYTEKVWGIPCNKIQAEWAAQRIQGLSLFSVLRNAVTGGSKAKSLIKEFQYPVYGPGMMWEAFERAVQRLGGEVRTHADVTAIHCDGGRVTGVTVSQDGRSTRIDSDQVISSMPLSELVEKLDPPPPAAVQNAARGLSYRDFLIVCLFVDQPILFPDNWIYIHSPDVRVGRIQNFKNWSPAMVPDPQKTSLGMEYFCNEGDDLWMRDDDDLIQFARAEIDRLGLANAQDVFGGAVIRQLKAYPVYDGAYRENVDVIARYLATLAGLQTIGRNGLHRYNNQDHAMLTGLYAARNLFGGKYDLWSVNTERSYHEDFTREVGKDAISGSGGRDSVAPSPGFVAQR